jgi:hypothetical protein
LNLNESGIFCSNEEAWASMIPVFLQQNWLFFGQNCSNIDALLKFSDFVIKLRQDLHLQELNLKPHNDVTP